MALHGTWYSNVTWLMLDLESLFQLNDSIILLLWFNPAKQQDNKS